MITIPVIEHCPYTVAGTGVLKLAHPVIETLAGAVYDKIEWIALLVGTRSENGLEVVVNELRVPLQERSHANCSLVRQEPLGPEIVGVVHSHHNMGAFFSTTDDDTLNTRFPLSIVVAQTRHNSQEVEDLLGFNYKAEGRAPLPCGGIGIIEFTVIPEPNLDIWPAKPVAGFVAPSEQAHLHNCPFSTRKREGLVQQCSTTCGIIRTETAKVIFGRNGKQFIKEVNENTKHGKYGNMVGQNGGVVVTDQRYFPTGVDGWKRSPWERDDDFIRHWGEANY